MGLGSTFDNDDDKKPGGSDIDDCLTSGQGIFLVDDRFLIKGVF